MIIINNKELLQLRQNNQLPLATRKIFAKYHMNAVKLMKILYQQWNCGKNSMKNNNLGTLSKINEITGIPSKHISIAMITWKIYLFRSFAKSNPLFINKQINHYNLFRELNVSKKAYLRLRNNTNLSDKRCCMQFHCPIRQSGNIIKYLKIPKLSKDEVYQRKMVTEYVNNEKKYGKGIKNSFQIPSVKKKIKKTINKRFENGYKTIAAKTRQHLLETEGIVNVGQRKDVKDKILKTLLKNKNQEELFEKHKANINFFEDDDFVKKQVIKAFNDNNKEKLTLTELSRKYHNSYFTWAAFRRNNYQWCKQYITLTGSYSQLEKDFEKEVLQKIGLNYKIHVNNILSKQNKTIHFDFLLTDYNILLELNPTFTHHVSKYKRYDRPNRLWKFYQAKLHGYTLLNFYDLELEDFNKCIEIIKNAINKINDGYVLLTDGVPYPVKTISKCAFSDLTRYNRKEKQKVINNPTVYNEGYTFWKK